MRRSRSQRTMSTRARRTYGPSASSCCGFWGKAATERYCVSHRAAVQVVLLVAELLGFSRLLPAGLPGSESRRGCGGKNICHESIKEGALFSVNAEEIDFAIFFTIKSSLPS